MENNWHNINRAQQVRKTDSTIFSTYKVYMTKYLIGTKESQWAGGTVFFFNFNKAYKATE